MIRLVRALLGMDRRAWYRLHIDHLHTDLLGRFLETTGNQAIKKTGLNKQFGRDQSVPGLFSELFNVAASRPAQMTTEWAKTSPGEPFRQDTAMVNPIEG